MKTALALWIKRGDALVPADPATEAWVGNVQQGDYVTTSAPQKPRNPKYHRLMMAALQKVVEHTWPRFYDIAELMEWLKMKTRMVDEVKVIEGDDLLVTRLTPSSISFASMDEIAFKATCEKWLHVICTELMPGTDPDDLLREAL